MKQSHSAFTLLELLITVSISVVVLTITTSTFASVSRLLSIQSQSNTVTSQVGLQIQKIDDDYRAASSSRLANTWGISPVLYTETTLNTAALVYDAIRSDLSVERIGICTAKTVDGLNFTLNRYSKVFTMGNVPALPIAAFQATNCSSSGSFSAWIDAAGVGSGLLSNSIEVSDAVFKTISFSPLIHNNVMNAPTTYGYQLTGQISHKAGTATDAPVTIYPFSKFLITTGY